MVVIPGFSLHVPRLLADSQAGVRLHNQFLREAMRDELHTHWRKRIPLHFGPGAMQRYGYMPRQPKYVTWKRRKYGSTGPLIKTGATQRLMRSQARIAVGGAAEGGKQGLTGRLTLRFSWESVVAASMRRKHFRPGMTASQRAAAAARVRPRSGVNLEQMRREIQAITQAEADEIARSLSSGYVHRVNTDASPRLVKKV